MEEVYGYDAWRGERLRGLNVKLGVPEGRLRDPTDGLGGAEWAWGEARKVFIL